MRSATNRARRRSGFTLVEIMIALLILSLLLAIAVPSFMLARQRAQTKTCVSNLRQIRCAKEVWAMAAIKGVADPPPTWDDLRPAYLKREPRCPADGVYTIGAVDVEPTCSVGGEHTIN